MLDHENFLNLCKNAQNIIITAPAGADGDSVGTQCALYEIFEYLYPEKKLFIINEEFCPKKYIFLENTKHFLSAEDLKKQKWSSSEDLWICVDGGPNRLGETVTPLWEKAKWRAQIDHHSVSKQYELHATLNDPTAASTTQIVYEFCQHHRIPLTTSLAQSLYVGLVYDTGLFKHSNTTPKVMRIGAHLLEFGFNHTQTAEKTLLLRTQGTLNLTKNILSNMHFELSGNYTWSALSLSDYKTANADSGDKDGLIDILFLTKDCEVAALFTEIEDNKWKVSFRARRLDVASLAKSVDPNGGGHRLAAGCSIDKTQIPQCHEAIKKLILSKEWI